MANDRLRQALQNAGLQPDQLADLVAVDERTVRRWLTGVTPYARHRGTIERALNATAQDLWPEIPQPAITDSVSAFSQADDPDAPTIEVLIGAAAKRIDLLDNTLDRLLESTTLTDQLLAKASRGCHVRILVRSPDGSLGPLLRQLRIEIKPIPPPVDLAIHRVDDQILASFSLETEHDQPPVLLHIRKHRAPGLFERLARHYEHVWEHASETLVTERDLDSYLHEHHHPGAGASDDAQDTAALDRLLPPAADAPVRHWPRRPQ